MIVERMSGALEPIQEVIDPDRLLDLQREVDQVYVDPALMEYAVDLVTATRRPEDLGLDELVAYIDFGASPRASINLILAGRALAFLRGRTYTLAKDVRDLAHDVMRHRLVLSYEALADNVSSDQLLDRLVDSVMMPEILIDEDQLARRPS